MANQLSGDFSSSTFRRRNVALATLCLATACALVPQSSKAQAVRVDITPSHALNRFVPGESLGSGIDRIPVEAIDKDFTKPVLNQVFAAGWRPVSYRQNTELVVEAWHWNPEGT